MPWSEELRSAYHCNLVQIMNKIITICYYSLPLSPFSVSLFYVFPDATVLSLLSLSSTLFPDVPTLRRPTTHNIYATHTSDAPPYPQTTINSCLKRNLTGSRRSQLFIRNPITKQAEIPPLESLLHNGGIKLTRPVPGRCPGAKIHYNLALESTRNPSR